MQSGYKAAFFDCDNTLLDFDAAEQIAFAKLLKSFNISPVGAIDAYKKLNSACWLEFERGTLKYEALRVERFRRFSNAFCRGVNPEEMSLRYDAFLMGRGEMIKNADVALEKISKHMPVIIITNGSGNIQRSRIAASKIAPFVSYIYISEECASRKPDPGMLIKALKDLNIKPSEAIMVGDSLTSDMPAARSANVDFAWYNPRGAAVPKDAKVKYIASDVLEFPNICTQK